MIHKRKLFNLLVVVLATSMVVGACQPAQPVATEPVATVEEVTKAPEVVAPEPTATVAEVKTAEPVLPTDTPEPVEEKPFVRGMDATPLYGGTLVVPRWPDFPTCNPAISTDIGVSSMLGNVFDGLIRQNEAFEPQPELAESWEVAEDGLTITFYLRKGVSWHDGVPFTSADVKFSFEEALSKLHPRGKIPFSAIESIDTPDDYTVIFNMNEPKSGFMYQANAPETLIIPKHIYENEDLVDGPHATCQELPVGTGPFKAKEYVMGSYFKIERNNDWWGTAGNYWGKGQPFLDEIMYAFIPDNTARMNGFETGEFHYLSLLMFPRSDYARFNAMPGRTVSLDGMSMIGVQTFYGFNLRNEPFSDLCVRQSIAHAMDLGAINDKVYYGTGFPSMSFLQPSHPEYNPNLEPYPYQPRDLAKAEAILDECGYTRKADGWRFELSLSYESRAERLDLAEIFKQLVEDIGIKVNLDGGDYSVWTENTYIKHDYDVTVATLGVAEPSVGVSRLFLSTNIGEALFNNSSAYVNPEMDELWHTYSISFDPKVRKEAIFRIQEIILEDLPYLYVNANLYVNGWNSAEFDGFHIDTASGSSQHRNVWWKQGRAEP